MLKSEREILRESDLRDWLRNTWGPGGHGLSWIEPTRGSSVGVPDVLVPLYPRLIPMELKINKQKSNARWFKTDVRPAQIRYHQSLAEDMMMSVFLVANGTRDDFGVWLTPGYVKIWKANESHNKVGWYLVAEHQNSKGMENREKLKSVLREIEREIYPIDEKGNSVMPW